MTSLRRVACLALALAAVTLVAACGGAASTAQTNPTPTPTVAPTATATVAPTATATAATATAPVKTGTATVNGTSETILTTFGGLTLYYRTSDTPPSNVCSGGCAQAWPPLLFSGTPPAIAGLPGHLTTQMTANGSQVEYNGHPLYTYAGDSAPGQTTGEGINGVWKVCTPGLA